MNVKVRMAEDKATKMQYAAKILHKRQIVKENKVKYVNSEKAIMDQLRHPNIVRLFYTFQTKEDLCILSLR
jgi:3-phosphoinositide dependent protein kinase-1